MRLRPAAILSVGDRQIFTFPSLPSPIHLILIAWGLIDSVSEDATHLAGVFGNRQFFGANQVRLRVQTIGGEEWKQ